MKTELILVGKTNDKHFQAGIDDYCQRIGHYMPFSITVIPELKNTKSLSFQQQKEREGEMILAKLQSSDHVVLLDEHGKDFRSVCTLDRAEKCLCPTSRVCNWRSLWLLGSGVFTRK